MFLQCRYSNLTCIFTEAINLSSFGTFHNYWPYVIVEWFAIYIHIQIIHSMWMGILRLRDTFDCVRVCLWIMTATGIHTDLVQLWIYIMNTNVYKQKHSRIFVFTLILRHSEVISNKKETSCLPLVKPGFEAVRLMHPFPSRLNAGSQTHWAIENQVKKIGLPGPHDERAFGPLDATAGIVSPLTRYTYEDTSIFHCWYISPNFNAVTESKSNDSAHSLSRGTFMWLFHYTWRATRMVSRM